MSLVATDLQQCLLQEVEQLKIGIPRGLRVHASPRVAGHVKPSPKIGPRKESLSVVRIYSLRVEPGGRVKKAKELMREQSRPANHLDWYDEQQTKERIASPEPEAQDSMLDKSLFRRDRVRRFEGYRQFPALVNQKLLPCCPQGTGATDLDHRKRIVLPTVSMVCKKQDKRPEPQTGRRAWKQGCIAEAQQLISSDRAPLMVDEPYAPPASLCRSPSRDIVILPSVRSADVQAVNDFSRQVLESQIESFREQGRENIEVERVLYEQKRNRFLNLQQFEDKRRGCQSPFEAHCKKLDQQRQVQQRRQSAIDMAKGPRHHAVGDKIGDGLCDAFQMYKLERSSVSARKSVMNTNRSSRFFEDTSLLDEDDRLREPSKALHF